MPLVSIENVTQPSVGSFHTHPDNAETWSSVPVLAWIRTPRSRWRRVPSPADGSAARSVPSHGCRWAFHSRCTMPIAVCRFAYDRPELSWHVADTRSEEHTSELQSLRHLV